MSTSLSQRELINALTQTSGARKKDATSVFEALSEIIRSEIAKGCAVAIPGAVNIQCKDRPARMVRNPAMGEKILNQLIAECSRHPSRMLP